LQDDGAGHQDFNLDEEAVSSPVQSLPEFLAARNSLVVDGCLTGESLPLPPDHPLKCPDLMLFGVVQSKDQMAASHLEGLLAGPDSSKTRVYKIPASARVAKATAHRGSRPAVALLNVQDHRYASSLSGSNCRSMLPLQSL
jgi:hypothetical protein